MLLRMAEINLLLQIAKRHRAYRDWNVYNSVIWAPPAEDVSLPVLLTKLMQTFLTVRLRADKNRGFAAKGNRSKIQRVVRHVLYRL